MFRRRGNAGGDLPTTMGAPASASSSGEFLRGGPASYSSDTVVVDGSAKSIHLQSPVVKKWKQSSRTLKITYIVTLISFFCVVFGWRSLAYYSARVYLECTTTECNVVARGVGRQRAVKLNVPRHQILGAYPVKVNAEGKVVKHKVNINEEWKYEASRSKKKKTNFNNYKGPDKDGNYLSYVVELQNMDANEKQKKRIKPESPQGDLDPDDDGWKERAVDQADSIDLEVLMPFFTPALDENGNAMENKYHIVMRQHGMAQTRRRVRNTVQKIDSYAKKRRHKLSVKENTSPHWKGVLMMVLGGVVFLLSLLLGMFWEDDEATAQGGPGARRKSHPQQRHHNGKRAGSHTSQNVNPYQRTTPSKYEVSMKPKKANTRSGGGSSVRRRS